MVILGPVLSMTMIKPMIVKAVLSGDKGLFTNDVMHQRGKGAGQKVIFNGKGGRVVQSVKNTFFFTEYDYRLLYDFQKSPNTEYQILFVIEKIRIPNTKYYLVSRKSEYKIKIVLFGLNIRKPITNKAKALSAELLK